MYIDRAEIEDDVIEPTTQNFFFWEMKLNFLGLN